MVYDSSISSCGYNWKGWRALVKQSEQSWKNYNQGSVSKLKPNTFGHKLTLKKSLTALDAAF